MKSLINFINENNNIFEATDEDILNNANVEKFKKTTKTINIFLKLSDAFRDLKQNLKNKPCSIFNSSDRTRLFNALLYGLAGSNSARALNMIKPFGVRNPDTLAAFIFKNNLTFTENKFDMSMIKKDKKSQVAETVKQYKATHNDYIDLREFDEDEYLSNPETKEDAIRTVLFYDANDPSNMNTILCGDYKYKRSKDDDHIINMAKLDWSLQTGLSYYDCRPIFAYNYYAKGKNNLKNSIIGLDD